MHIVAVQKRARGVPYLAAAGDGPLHELVQLHEAPKPSGHISLPHIGVQLAPARLDPVCGGARGRGLGVRVGVGRGRAVHLHEGGVGLGVGGGVGGARELGEKLLMLRSRWTARSGVLAYDAYERSASATEIIVQTPVHRCCATCLPCPCPTPYPHLFHFLGRQAAQRAGWRGRAWGCQLHVHGRAFRALAGGAASWHGGGAAQSALLRVTVRHDGRAGRATLHPTAAMWVGTCCRLRLLAWHPAVAGVLAALQRCARPCGRASVWRLGVAWLLRIQIRCSALGQRWTVRATAGVLMIPARASICDELLACQRTAALAGVGSSSAVVGRRRRHVPGRVARPPRLGPSVPEDGLLRIRVQEHVVAIKPDVGSTQGLGIALPSPRRLVLLGWGIVLLRRQPRCRLRCRRHTALLSPIVALLVCRCRLLLLLIKVG